MCEDLCLRVPRCVAYNYQYSLEEGGKGRFCELMNEVAIIKDRPGYSFRLFERERAMKVSKDQDLLSLSNSVESNPPPPPEPRYPLRGGFPYQSNQGAHWKFCKTPLKGTKIHFWGRDSSPVLHVSGSNN